MRPPPLLQPIIDLLQYQVFCERVKAEVDRMERALDVAGVPSSLRFNAVGESGKELVKLLDEVSVQKIGGEAVLRIDDRYACFCCRLPYLANEEINRHTLRFTFISPSFLTAHLPQATLTLSSIPQLVQLLSDEVESCLLNRICEIGREMCDRVNGTWFVDMVSSRSVGRWEGCVLLVKFIFGLMPCSAYTSCYQRNFRVFYNNDYSIRCSAFRLDHGRHGRETALETYSTETVVPLLSWVQQMIDKTLTVH